VTYSFADVAERLMARFEGKVPLDVVVRVARESEADLYRSGAPQGAALGELVERSAEQRLAEIVAEGAIDPAPTDPLPAPRSKS
jgi:hypothetical protein